MNKALALGASCTAQALSSSACCRSFPLILLLLRLRLTRLALSHLSTTTTFIRAAIGVELDLGGFTVSASTLKGTTMANVASSSKPSDEDLDRLLNREATAFQREVEVERILKAFKLKYVPLTQMPLLPG